MKKIRLWMASVIICSTALLVSPLCAQAQNAAPRAKKPAAAQAAQTPPAQVAQTEQKCLRALNGACTNPTSVEVVRLRAEIIPAVRVSYLGTPAGTIGGRYIPFERFFQDNPLVFGLPTFVFVQACCTVRTK
jgi:hypothetical protein